MSEGFGARVAVVGCGGIGQIYCDRLKSLRVPVIGVVDVDPARAARAAEIVRAAAYSRLEDLLNGDVPDVVCICTPTADHHATSIAAARAGCDIFSEKPLARTLQEAREIVTTCLEHRVSLAMGFKMRFESVFNRAWHLIQDGHIGDPLHAVFTFYQPVPPPAVRWYMDMGAMLDLLVHPIDLAAWMLEGQPELVYAQHRHALGYKGEDRAFLLIEEGKGRTATIQGGWIDGYPPIAASDDICFQVVGSRGYLVGRRPDQLTEVGWNGVIVHPITPRDAFKEELRAYFTAREHGEVAPVPGAAGVSAQAVIEAARRSASELRGGGVPVETG